MFHDRNNSPAICTPRRRLLSGGAWVGMVIAVAVCGLARPTRADSWMFAPSYYSHQPSERLQPIPDPPQSRGAYRRPFYNQQPGFAIRGGYRYNSIVINSGLSYDRTVIREDWFDVRP